MRRPTARRDLRLLLPAAGVWAAALLAVHQPWSVQPLIWACLSAAAVLSILVEIRRRRTGASSGAGLAVVVLVGMAAAAVSVVSVLPAREQAAAAGGRVVEVMAEVTSSASVGRDGRLWFEAQTVTIGARDAPRRVSAPVRIGVEPADGFELGAGIRVVGEAEATDAGERSALVVYASEAEVVRPASGVFGVAADMREAFIDRATRLPEPGAGLLPGLAVGDTRAVSAELNDDMRTTGLSHLTAVSGANCAIVVGAMFWIAALCGAGRRVRVAVAAAALAGFVVLVTPEPSVVRAAVMAGVGMLTLLLGRPSAGAGMLALSATGILIADPWLAATPGFALSVAASGALILLAPPLARGLGRAMPQPLALMVAVPLAAQLVCGPVIALFADQQSLIGLAANLVAAPAAPIATVIGLLACLAAPLPVVADLLAASAWLPSAWISTTATVTAPLPLARIMMPAGAGSAALVALVSACVGVVLTGGLRRARPVRILAVGVLTVVTALGAAHVLLSGPLATATSPDGWAIAACDVGQGDALLVRSGTEVALIDTGPEPQPLADCLRALGIDHIDFLVLTHFDLDHVGGVDAVQGRVTRVLHGPTGERDDEHTLQRLADGGATLTAASTGLRGELGASDWRILWPQRASAAFPPGNDASVVMEVAGGGVPRSLFLGDLSAEAQRALQRAAHLSGGYAVVKVAHHGSADQDPGLYDALRPSVALFSAGVDNDYGHPRAETLALLEGVGARSLRTDVSGRLLVGMSDDSLQVWTETAPP